MLYSCLVCVRLSFLLTDSAFMNLLNVDTPIDVLEKACAVLILSMQDKQAVKSDLTTATQKPSFFVPQLCSLLSLKQPANYNHQVRFNMQDDIYQLNPPPYF